MVSAVVLLDAGPLGLVTNPKSGMDRRQYIGAKFGSVERFGAMEQRLESVGAGEAIDFKFGNIRRLPNKLDAHRLIWLAQQHGKQDAVVEAGSLKDVKLLDAKPY